MTQRHYTAAVVLFAISVASCSSWGLRSEDGRECVARKGQSAEQLFAVCGPPDRSATQPKRIESGASLGALVACSAPAYAYGKDVVLMGCKGHVVGVEAADDAPVLIFDAGGGRSGALVAP